MRTHSIVVSAPGCDGHLRFRVTAKSSQTQALVAKPPIKAFIHAVPPRLAWIDQRVLDACGFQLFENSLARDPEPPSRC
jgi:hypothetical protein